MTRQLLVLRPQPGADATAARAREMGLAAMVSPLFRVAGREWELPHRPFDGLLVTSANAARLLDARLDRGVRVFAVGTATADAMRAAGFEHVHAGASGVSEIVREAVAQDVGSLLHLNGEDRTLFDPAGIHVETRIVDAAEAIEPGCAFFDALSAGAVALLHSARAALRFRELAGAGHGIAAISPAVLTAAGDGWADSIAADQPTDEALLAAAARLCQ